MRSHESSCCSPPLPSPPPWEIQNVACRHDHRRSQICRRHHASIHASAGAITIAVQFASKRGIAKTVAVLHLRLRYRKSGKPRDVTITDEPNLSAATSRIHTSAGAATIAVQLASKRDIAKALQGQPGEFGATRVLLSNTRASDVTAATAGISNSASYVLSVSCLFLCGPLRRISVNARFYVQCCLVL
ncbi:hypothetical protein NP493_101g08011 [Ridgeia piscesae]|uniref:Uncharacterized protein n=1 Tax=Ridgeia piscesae TaxID=27915 RepID=A0AAD9UHJ3_RIDPI|nr:hypothetical protein NP493_101g08011 [Ridgeia piscesae]